MISCPRKLALLVLFSALFLYTGCSQDVGLHNPDSDLQGSVEKTIPAGYYDTVDTSTQAALRSTLHQVIDDHTKIPYTATATDTWNVLELADQDPNNSGRILDVYLNASYIKYGEGNTDYNREHSWPKSYGFPDDLSSNYPYTDCHHLFLCNDSYNTSRSNKPYRYGTGADLEKPTELNDGAGGGTGVYPGNSNWTSGSYTAGTWETWIGRRGDVARALLYMDVRYEGGVHGVTGHSEPDLILTDSEALILASNTGNMESIAYMGMLSVLLQWHTEDPVDAKEMARNDAVYNYQGNRNPFVDHPEWVDCVFSGLCGGGDTTPPAAPTGLGATAGDGSVTLNWNNNAEGDLAGYSVYRGTSSGGPYSLANGSLLTVSQFTDTGRTNGVTYYYVVTASDASSNESIESSEVSATPAGGGGGGDPAAWINEFHYDNDSTDTGEFFEIAGTAGLNLSGWTVYGYNGNGGVVYDTEPLSGTLPDLQGGFGALSFTMVGMQNGSPDGLALTDDIGAVVMFISYEGQITATDGPAAGLTSTDIGVSEPTTSPIGWSLQLGGSGSAYADFSWQAPQTDTPGAVNSGQTFVGAPTNQAPVAEANGPYSGSVGAAISFSSAGSYDADGTIVGWAWNFGDGGSSTLANPTHTYTAAGNFTVTLTVTDDLGATGGDTASASALDTTPPAAPTGLIATAADGSVDLDWANNSEGDLAGYTVYRSTVSGSGFAALNGTLLTTSAYTDNTVNNGTTYYYVVTADDDSGNESANSGETSALPFSSGGGDADVWINEFHYDNDGTDAGEGFEIAGPAGTSLSGWSVAAYNGNGGVVYDTEVLSGTLPNQMGGYGTLAFAMVGMQNGSPDGLALVDGTGTVVLFISYEGVIVATDGPAMGQSSVDIGVAEAADSPVGYSLQLSGTGTTYVDFTWQSSAANTSGTVNSGQTLGSGTVAPTADFSGTPVSGTYPLLVAFNDLSSDSPTSWSWTFGDGGTSTAQNPSHTYTTAGTFTVTLTAGNSAGSDAETKTGYITVDEPAAGGWNVITYDDFEGGMGNYTDGGGDMLWYVGAYSHQGSYSADIQDNSGVASSFYHTSGYDVSGYTDLEVEFWYKAISMDKSTEDFWVQYWDGSVWLTVEAFAQSIDFDNGVFYNVVVSIPSSSYNYPTDAKLRFMCDASGNKDDVFIDEIEFRGFN
jgi:PKD repeat protein/endonuclease I